MSIVVESVALYDGASGVSTHNVTMPSGIQAGDFLVAFVRRASASAGQASVDGWTRHEGTIFDGRSNPHDWVFSRVADGNEGATQTLTLSSARRIVAVVYRLSGVDPDKFAIAWGGDQSNDPPNVTAPWGSANNLFLAGVATSASNQTFTGPPANYSNQQVAANPSNSESTRCVFVTAQRALTAASDNPGTFDITGTLIEPESVTVVIGPAGAGEPGDPPQGTVTISAVTPNSTSAEVTYSYNDTDQTGFEYRLDGGTAASIGASPATITGLTAGTEYDLQIRAINADGESDWSSIFPFSTTAAGDPPQGTVTIGTISVTHNSASVPWSYDDTDHDGVEYRYRVTAGTWSSWTDAGLTTPIELSSLTDSTNYEIEARAYNADGTSTAASDTFATTAEPAINTITVTDPICNNTGTLLTSASGIRVAVLQAADLVSVFEDVGLTTDASGLLAPISDAAIIGGQSYHVMIKLADGGVGVTGPITAS